MINLDSHIPLLALFVVAGLAILTQIQPRTKVIMAELSAKTADGFTSTAAGLDFHQFMAWHEAVHSLDRRRSRLTALLVFVVFGIILGAVSSALGITMNLVGVTLAEPIVRGLDAAAGIGVTICVVGSLDPCYVIFTNR